MRLHRTSSFHQAAYTYYFRKKNLSKLFQCCWILFTGVTYWTTYAKKQESHSLKMRNITLAKTALGFKLLQKRRRDTTGDFSMAFIYFCLAMWYVGKTSAAWSRSRYCTLSFFQFHLLLSPPCLSGSYTSSNLLPLQMHSSTWKLFQELTLMT